MSYYQNPVVLAVTEYSHERYSTYFPGRYHIMNLHNVFGLSVGSIDLRHYHPFHARRLPCTA